MENNKNKTQEQDNKDAVIKPDPETLHTTDPQEHMEGPVSSIVQGIKEAAEKEDSPAPVKKEK